MKKSKQKKKSNISFRLNLIFFCVFILFATLILRLGIVQIVFGEDYKREIEQKEVVPINSSVPRGKIYDTNGKLVVGNTPLKAITYTRSTSVKQDEMLDIAKKLANLISKDSEEDFKLITKRDRQDYWIMNHPDEATAKIKKADKERLEKKELDKKEYDKEIYDLTRERITEEELNSFSKQELEVLAIFREMSSGTTLSPHIIKNKNVTDEEYAIVSEHLDTLPGVDTTSDWDRYFAFKDDKGNGPLSSVLGKVTSSKEGLPKDSLDYLLSKGYSRNDRVGKSYIESQYEDVLQGQKETVKNVTDKAGNVLESQVYREGKSGNDLVLSIDIEFQKRVDEIIEQKLGSARAGQPYMDRTLVSVMNPKTGEMLAMSGKQYVKDKETNKTEVQDFALGNMTTSYSMGSAVKGATVLTGYQTGAIKPGDYLNDRPLKFKGTQVKKSWNTSGFGSINDLYALKRSSNVYMFLTAMKIGGQQTYVPNGPLTIDKVAAINTFRKNFAEFGLGIRTGIDLPGEQTGYGGGQIPADAGKVLDFAIGQYDTYTPLQLVQYISTIANGGYRIQPHIVKEIHEPNNTGELGPIIEEIAPTVLNRIDMKDSWIDHVKDGLELVVNDPQGTGYGTIKNKQYKIAGKTGTAQALYDGPLGGHPMLWNVTFVGYAPYDNPEIAVSVVVPWSTTDATHVNLEIADEVFKAYFELKEKHLNEGKTGSEGTEGTQTIDNN
ncbi:peptidoglycan D,D-transpeptidase FtsI family protein [Neobacillus jeddahensis]|uniref:peptidoglycan D,D-transpeptidase FtsI family protein n=1 Tax=Neobacillus jeddahensis TaxID=1461580 RepID=UPI00058C62D3|nr:penicillin-binding protein 2 [Neobacillus jeddahensis]